MTDTVDAGIINYRCSEATIRCARSALTQSVRPKRIVIVDNNSGGESVEKLRKAFSNEPSVKIIANDRNVGFGAAQNQAIRSCDGEFYLALNPDAILECDYIERLVGVLRERPEAGYATGLIFFCEEDGSPTPYVFTAGHWFWRARTALNRYYGLSWPREWMESGEAGGASGCAPLYRRLMLESIDLGKGEFFDETYFMYVEDIDLDWRARLSGWKCWFEASAVAMHEGEITGGGRSGRIYAQLVTNRWLMILKNDRPGMFLRDFPYILKADLIHFWPTLIRYGGLRHVWRGLPRRVRDAWRKRAIVQRGRKASNVDIRRWMDESREDLRASNAKAAAHPDRIKPMPEK